MIAGFVVFIAVLVAWDQSGVLSVGATADEPRVAGVSYVRNVDLSPLAARLRISDAAAPTIEVVAPAAPPAAPERPLTRQADEVAIAPPPANFAKNAPPPPPARPPAQLRSNRFDGVTPAGGTWAVLIGVNDYPGDSHDLRSAVNDVNDVDAALAKLGVPGDRRLVMRDRQATAGTIRASLEWLVAHAGPDATAVFFFAGHVQKVSASTEALLGSDGELVTDADMASLLDRLQAKRTWIALAACYAGGFTEVVRPGRILTAAAPADSLAYENTRLGRSYLVDYMVRRAMIEKGLVTVEAAFSSAAAEIQRDHPNRMPVQFDEVSGDLDLRVAKAKGTTQPGQPAPGSSPNQPAEQQPPPGRDDGCYSYGGGALVTCSG